MNRSWQPTGCGSVTRRKTKKAAEFLTWEDGDNKNLAMKTDLGGLRRGQEVLLLPGEFETS